MYRIAIQMFYHGIMQRKYVMHYVSLLFQLAMAMSRFDLVVGTLNIEAGGRVSNPPPCTSTREIILASYSRVKKKAM